VAAAPVVYTDDTGWRIHWHAAHLMTFDTDQATVFQICRRHRNEEVRELIPADYAGVMVTDRGKSYDAENPLRVRQQKCLDHLKENITEVPEYKAGRARRLGPKLKNILRENPPTLARPTGRKGREFPCRGRTDRIRTHAPPAPSHSQG
jgi:transposase